MATHESPYVIDCTTWSETLEALKKYGTISTNMGGYNESLFLTGLKERTRLENIYFVRLDKRHTDVQKYPFGVFSLSPPTNQAARDVLDADY